MVSLPLGVQTIQYNQITNFKVWNNRTEMQFDEKFNTFKLQQEWCIIEGHVIF